MDRPYLSAFQCFSARAKPAQQKPEDRKPGRNKIEIDEQKLEQFNILFKQFLHIYIASEEGQRRIRLYRTARIQGRKNVEQVAAARERGQSITDMVVLKLLPHADTQAYRQKGAWIHPTRSGESGIKEWYEGLDWKRPAD
ncbi:MAG: hypothetical protein ACOC8C_02410 [Chloroflexota bacterium]